MGLSFPSSQHLYTSLAAATSLVSRHKCLGQSRVAREQMHGCFAQSAKVGVCKRPGGQFQVHSFPSSKHLYTLLAADRSLASRHNCLGQSRRACWRMHNGASRKASRWAFANVQVDDFWGSHFQAHSTSIRRWLLPRALSVATNAWVKEELPVSRCTGALRKAPRWAFANVQVDNCRCTHFQAQKHLYTFLAADRSLASRHNCLGQSKRACWRMHNDVSRKAPRWAFANVQVDDLWGSHFQAHSTSIRRWLLPRALSVATNAWVKAELPVSRCTGALRKAPRWAFANVQVDNFRCTHFQAQSISIRCWLLTGALPVATIAWDKAEGPVGGCTTVPRAKRPGGRLQTSRWTISGALISKLTAPLYVAGC